MKIIVFGATGRTGAHVVARLLEKNHDVTAYVRDAGRLAARSPRLRVIEKAMDDPGALAGAMAGQDAVISCLGSGTLGKSDVLETFAVRIRAAMESAGVKKIVYMASAGIHGEIKGLPGLIVRMILGRVLDDHARAAGQFTGGGFTYTIARPVQITDGPSVGAYRTSEDGVPGRKAISRADIARFLVDAAETDAYDNRSVGLSA